ncbi:MAG: hypothetical protein IJ723_03145, partial [Ruminococcus sp.]|nr:hypothetical protein [Ruminococcus sp.]
VVAKQNEAKKAELAYKLIKSADGDRVVFGIPFNIHFIGMMNDVDRSIDAFDLAFRRRFKWEATYCDYNVIKANCGLKEDAANAFVESCKLLNYYITGEVRDKDDKPNNADSKKSQNLGMTYQIGHGYFLNITKIYPNSKKTLKTRKTVLFDNYLKGTIKEYIVQNHGEGPKTDKIIEGIREEFLK